MNSSDLFPASKKSYDDISYEQRKKLIELIDIGKYTIRGAAKKTGIKLCTAKYIYYNFRNLGKIYEKNRGNQSSGTSTASNVEDGNQKNIVYVPYPVYIFCYSSPGEMPMGVQNVSYI